MPRIKILNIVLKLRKENGFVMGHWYELEQLVIAKEFNASFYI